jgi:hypothetical protein
MLKYRYMKKMTMGGAIIGMSIGSYVPLLWGGGFFSIWGVVISAVLGVVGIWLGYRIARGY